MGNRILSLKKLVISLIAGENVITENAHQTQV